MNLVPRNFFLDDLFDDLPEVKNNNMKCDIYEKDDKYYIEMDVPGFKKEDISIDCDNGYLTINVDKNTLSSSPDTYIRRERLFGQIKRSFYIGIKKETDIKAIYKEGVLIITFPKEDVPRKLSKNINIA